MKGLDEKGRFPVGAVVESARCGSKASFIGVVTAHFGGEYHVADANGKGWHRSHGELSFPKNDHAELTA